MISKGMDRVVDDNGLGEVATQLAQVLDESAWLRGQTVLAVQSMMNELIVRIKELYASICVHFLYTVINLLICMDFNN